MAKVIRNRWVYRPDNKWTRYLPRRNEGVKEYDYEKNCGTLEDYKMETSIENNRPVSKLWMAWLYRDLSGEPKWTRKYVESLFGQNYKIGRMEVFRNTPLINEELWKVKHLIELRPVNFLNGEPTENDIFSTKLSPNGDCEITASGHVDNESDLYLIDETKQLTKKEIHRDLTKKHYRNQSVFESNVYTSSNITVVK